MKITAFRLRQLIREVLELDLEVGDVILTGKFKNKRTVIKKFGKDDLGQPTINDRPLNFRIEKLLPKEKWSKKTKEEEGIMESKRLLRKIVKEAIDADAVYDDLETELRNAVDHAFYDGLGWDDIQSAWTSVLQKHRWRETTTPSAVRKSSRNSY